MADCSIDGSIITFRMNERFSIDHFLDCLEADKLQSVEDAMPGEYIFKEAIRRTEVENLDDRIRELVHPWRPNDRVTMVGYDSAPDIEQALLWWLKPPVTALTRLEFITTRFLATSTAGICGQSSCLSRVSAANAIIVDSWPFSESCGAKKLIWRLYRACLAFRLLFLSGPFLVVFLAFFFAAFFDFFASDFFAGFLADFAAVFFEDLLLAFFAAAFFGCILDGAILTGTFRFFTAGLDRINGSGSFASGM